MIGWAGLWLGKEEIGLGTHLWGCGLNYLDIQGRMRMNYNCVFESRGVGLVGWVGGTGNSVAFSGSA
jgi:hypothetical protein